jgi:hypothetical protein
MNSSVLPSRAHTESPFCVVEHRQVQNVGFRKAAQDKADALACFGWVQNSEAGTVVGEARCSKKRGPLFKVGTRMWCCR